MKLNKLTKLIVWIVLFEVIGFSLGFLTQANMYPWYEHLNKSALTPPGFVFSIAWSVLYALLAIIAWILSSQVKKYSKKINTLFALQMLMNWAWTPLFFKLHWLTVSAIWLMILTGLNFILMIETKKTDKKMAWLLTPYILWLMFASYLNGVIAIMN